jgi:hypothetical protein
MAFSGSILALLIAIGSWWLAYLEAVSLVEALAASMRHSEPSSRSPLSTRRGSSCSLTYPLVKSSGEVTMIKVKTFFPTGEADLSVHRNLNEASCEAFDSVWNNGGGVAWIDAPGMCYRFQLEVMPLGSSGVRGRVAPRKGSPPSGTGRCH